jgi:hypothetical protein
MALFPARTALGLALGFAAAMTLWQPALNEALLAMKHCFTSAELGLNCEHSRM